MKTKNPAKEFIKKIEAIIKAAQTLTKDKYDTETGKYIPCGYWPFYNSHEANPEDCFKREDGLWQLKKKLYHGRGNPENICVFIWRTHPNYCTLGQPCTSNKDQMEFYEKSETEKVLYETEKHEFVWKWYEVITPTRTCWGLRMGKTYFEVRDKVTKEVFIRRPEKSTFIRCYNELFPAT